jgi:DNA uptake protein ComE-like DNA-binding protein
LSYRGIAVRCVVTAFVTGAFGTAAATEPNAKPQSSASATAQPPASAPADAKAPPHGMPGARPPAKAPVTPPKKVDINNASLAELKTLPTVGDAEAKKIIAHRPYKSKGELMTKAGLPEGVYQAVKRNVELQAPRKAAATK